MSNTCDPLTWVITGCTGTIVCFLITLVYGYFYCWKKTGEKALIHGLIAFGIGIGGPMIVLCVMALTIGFPEDPNVVECPDCNAAHSCRPH